ncbi:MAG: methylenetetrahydrofolate reductase [NAD(P)H] [Bacteroidota bacterium]|nr:methylenetetrahydrofolate reductase [NAD(P)H] [Bacteroidota bacterium]
MKVTDHIKNAKRTLFTIELLPPLKGENINSIYQAIEPLLLYEPSYINVTYHREEVVYKPRPDGLIESQVIRKRPGTVSIAAAIRFKYGIDVVPHMICGGFRPQETEDGLIDLHFLGIDNVLALRGDPPKNEKAFVNESGGHVHASDLVHQISRLNKGIYLEEDLLHPTPTDFCVGVAGYPEKHSESPNMETDLMHLKEKVDAGADYIVTQLFFDNRKFIKFVEQCRAIGIKVPIIPGLKPLSVKNHLNLLPGVFSIDIPMELVQEVQKCKDNTQVREVGIEWAIAQSKELMQFGVPALHFYTMGKSDNVCKIAKAIF